ncbi:emerin isoform X1 [Sarcophilus harrisii]|uniref:Emerin n=1 Tax=Sarcophilus harrisii TaxID=9305 RepID=G3VJV5_SARHA|nr:emerin isoform X1 [Sarcophilus harrisii]
MEEYRRLSDEELSRMLKLYNIPHGPVVGSTRKLYEKKIYEYESQRTKLPPGTIGSYQHAEDFESDAYDSNQDEEGSLEDIDFDNYYEESYSTTKTYGEFDDTSANPVVKAKTSFLETLPSARRGSDSAKGPTYHLRQRVQFPRGPLRQILILIITALFSWMRENILCPSAQEEDLDTDPRYYSQDSGAYRNIYYRPITDSAPDSSFYSGPVVSSSTPVSSTSPSFRWYTHPSGVEARQAIRAGQGYGAEIGKNGRMVSLWVQFLLFLGFALFLAFFYYFMQAGDDNPFRLRN